MNPRVFVISGPSGVGKSSVIKQTMERLPQLSLSISSTTRAIRPGEVQGRDYHFIPRDEFETKIQKGEFLEWAQVYDHYYGTDRSHVEKLLVNGNHAILDVDTQGAMNIKTVCSGVVFIFIKPPSLALLEERLRGRGTETEESLAKRLSKATHELGFSAEYDFVIVNDELEQAVAEMVGIFEKEESKANKFLFPANGEAAVGEEPGDQLFMEHLLEKLHGEIVNNFTSGIRENLRRELVGMIKSRLRNVLERDLGGYIQEAMRAPRREP